MIFTFLITIVFIAEIIIAIAIIHRLLLLDKAVIELKSTLEIAKPKLCDICSLVRNISEQWIDLSEDFVEKFKTKGEDITLRILSKLLIAMILWKLNSKAIKRIRNSRTYKILGKGLSLLENVV